MRISRKQLWMGMAELAAKRSTCYRGNVGAVVIMHDNPVAIGYNGPRTGDDHCKGTSCEIHAETKGCLRSVHAEVNALARIPNVMWPAFGGEMFVTSNPCPDCATQIIASGLIGRVYYQSPYRITTGITELLNADIEVYRFSPSGYQINEATGEVIESA